MDTCFKKIGPDLTRSQTGWLLEMIPLMWWWCWTGTVPTRRSWPTKSAVKHWMTNVFQMGFKANDHSLRCFAALLQLARSHRVLISGTLREDGSGGLALVCFGSWVGGSRDVINLGQFWGNSHHDLSKDDGRQEKPYQNDFCWGFSFLCSQTVNGCKWQW